MQGALSHALSQSIPRKAGGSVDWELERQRYLKLASVPG